MAVRANPIQYQDHPLSGVFDALEAVGTHLVTKGDAERQRMLDIARDPEQSEILASRVRQAYTAGQSLEQIATGFGFTDKDAPEFLRRLTEANPQSSAERVEELNVLRDLPAKAADLLEAQTLNQTATEKARREMGIPVLTASRERGELDVAALERADLTTYLNRKIELGVPAVQADVELKMLESQGITAEQTAAAWNRYDRAISTWENSPDPNLRDIAAKAGVGLTEPQLLARLAHLERMDFEELMRSTVGAAGGLDLKDFVALQGIMQERRQDAADRLIEIEAMSGREKAIAKDEWIMAQAETAAVMQLLSQSDRMFGATFMGALTTDEKGRPSTLPFESGVGREVWDDLESKKRSPAEVQAEIDQLRKAGVVETEVQRAQSALDIWIEHDKILNRVPLIKRLIGQLGTGRRPVLADPNDPFYSLTHPGISPDVSIPNVQLPFYPFNREAKTFNIGFETSQAIQQVASGAYSDRSRGRGSDTESPDIVPQPSRIEPRRDDRPAMMKYIPENKDKPRVNLPGFPLGDNPALIQELDDELLDFVYRNNSISWGQYQAEAIRRGRK